MNHPGYRQSLGMSLFAAAAVLGALVPINEGCGACPTFVVAPDYRIREDQDDWVPGSGRIKVTDTAFIISYATKDGSKWEVEYRRIEEPGGD
jgi:hypothetical protein